MTISLPVLDAWLKPAATIALLGALWTWETLHPFFPPRHRLRHAGHNLAIAVFNTAVLAVLFGAATLAVANATATNDWGVLNQFSLAGPVRFGLALLLADLWLYVWHRANHRIPLLWRFHRMHHSDNEMDVTTATRFHLGEHIGSSILRLGLIPLVGFEVRHLLVYDMLVIAGTMFHHANISIGRCDAPLRALIVTPFMHKVHHSRWQPETDSNYSVVFSCWDRLFRSYRWRDDYAAIEFGLADFDEPRWQKFVGMLQTPFTTPATTGCSVAEANHRSEATSSRMGGEGL